MSEIGAVNRTDVQSVLAQMRALRQAASGELLKTLAEPDVASATPSVASATQIAGQPATTSRAGFGQMLASAIKQVNALEVDADVQRNAFVRGDTQDLVKVMIAAQKSEVAFQAAAQVRNRLVSAYQDIMNMPI